MRKTAIELLMLGLTLGLLACTPPKLPAGSTETGSTETGDGDPSTGDGDGDPTTGDGDGDPSTGDGDGDPNTGDGDGDPSTGDGDGDEPQPCAECDDYDYGCHQGTCNDPLSSIACGIDFCDELDGDPELLLTLTAHQFPVPPGLFVGAQLLVSAHHDYGGDSYVTAFDTVRSLDDGQLIAANRVGDPSPAIESMLDETFAALYDPFVLIEDETPGWCEPQLKNEDCWDHEDFIRINHADDSFSRLRNDTYGYASGGYGLVVTNARHEEGEGCWNETAPYPQVYMVRTDCGDDCPPPTVVDSCTGAPNPDPVDRMRVHPSGWIWFPYEAWEWECVVVEINELDAPEGVTELEIPLDCLNLKATSKI